MKYRQRISGLLLGAFLAASLAGIAQTDSSMVKLKNPSSVAVPKGYSQVAVVDLGNCTMLVLSGQVPFDNKGNLVGKDNMGKQAEQVFLNIRNIVTELGGTMDNVIKLGVYMVDVSQIQAFRDARDKFVNTKNPPASTLVQVSKLFRDDVLIEVEATAIISKK